MCSSQAEVQAIIPRVRSPSPAPPAAVQAIIPCVQSPSPDPSYRNTRPRYDDPAISDDETDHANLPKLSEEDPMDWQHAISALVDKSFTLSAPGVEEASTALLNLLTRLVNNTPAFECLPKPNFQVAGGACCTINHVDQLVYPLPPFIIGSGKEAAVGNGPVQAVYKAALALRVQQKRWNEIHGTYQTIKLSLLPGLESRASLAEYRVDGALTALLLIHLLLEPAPISPFLVYTAFSPGPECLDFLVRESCRDYKLAHLLQMIPDKGKQNKPAEMYAHIVGRLALEIGVDPTFFVDDREKEQHIGVTRRLLGELLLACQEPWEQGQFLAFTEGFRLELSTRNNIAQACFFRFFGTKKTNLLSCSFKLRKQVENDFNIYWDAFDQLIEARYYLLRMMFVKLTLVLL
ncbi:hypothetical protein AX14_012315 [Amanita brunnescens Koide BX004]|nr:hypothetical protein AX14_012315 [Amanita brunnescens Koide BX004]